MNIEASNREENLGLEEMKEGSPESDVFAVGSPGVEELRDY